MQGRTQSMGLEEEPVGVHPVKGRRGGASRGAPSQGGAEEEPAGVHPVKGRRGGTSRGAPSQGAQRGRPSQKKWKRIFLNLTIVEEPAPTQAV